MDEDFWITEISGTPEHDSGYGNFGKLLLIIVAVVCLFATAIGLIIHLGQ